jgi:site-specific DNA recombinase
MLNNPAYIGRAAFGRARFLPPRPRLRPIRGHLKPSPRAISCVPMPREEWIEIPVPSIVDPAVSEATRVQLEENRKRKRERARAVLVAAGADGLPVLRITYYGKTAPRSRKYDPMNALRYYRCTGGMVIGSVARRCAIMAPVRGDQLEQAVWDQVRALLEEPHRVAGEYRRRITQARDGAAMPEELVRLDRQITSLRRGIGRLINSYTEGVIDKTEFEPRMVRQRLSQLQERHQAALKAAEAERDLALVISRLEDFCAKVAKGLDNLDRIGMQDIIGTVVRRIEIDDSRIEVIFRVPPPDGPPGPRSPTKTADSWQHCTLTIHRLGSTSNPAESDRLTICISRHQCATPSSPSCVPRMHRQIGSQVFAFATMVRHSQGTRSVLSFIRRAFWLRASATILSGAKPFWPRASWRRPFC